MVDRRACTVRFTSSWLFLLFFACLPRAHSLKVRTKQSDLFDRTRLDLDEEPPPMCDKAHITLYGAPGYRGPAVSLGCSSHSLAQMTCFRLASLALRADVAVVLYGNKSFTGEQHLVTAAEPDLELPFAPQSALVCSDYSDYDKCRPESQYALPRCREEVPFGELGEELNEVEEIGSSMHHGSKFRKAYGGKVIMKYLRPRKVYDYTAGPEACFYKTVVREAQLGCEPAEHREFGELARRFMPRYLGAARGDLLGADHIKVSNSAKALDQWGEWILMDNAEHGLQTPNMLDVEPGYGRCAKCGLDVKNYKIWEPKSNRYRRVPRSMLAGVPDRRSGPTRSIGPLANFLQAPGLPRAHLQAVVRELKPRLERMGALLRAQRVAHFPDSSVLLFYGRQVEDADTFASRAVFIDFGQVVAADGSALPWFNRIPKETSLPSLRLKHGERGLLFCGLQELSAQLAASVARKLKPQCLVPKCNKCEGYFKSLGRG